jgi:hypothetical protein
MRRREASSLLSARQFPGAYYLLGYSIECALKACIAKQVRRHDFPDKELANNAYTHRLEKLMSLAGLSQELQRDMATSRPLRLNWAVVKDWTEQSRYRTGITEAEARDLYLAATARRHGILTWIRTRW